MTTATALAATVKNLPTTEKAAALIAAGYVNNAGKAAWTRFYEELLTERENQSEADHSFKVETMLNYVTLYGNQFSPSILSEYWEAYNEQVEIDGKTDDVDTFCEEFGLTEIDNYSDYADYSQDVVGFHPRILAG